MIAAWAARSRRAAAEYLPALLFLALLVAFWEVYVRVRDVKPYLLPPPSDIWTAFTQTRDTLPGHLRTTLTEALAGLVIGAAAGVALAALIAASGLARRVLYPIVVVSQNIPLIVLAPLLVVWFGFGTTPKIVVVALVSFFPIVVSTADALAHSDQEMVGLVRSMGGNRLQVLRLVRVPSAIPAFFAGLKIAATYAVLAAVVGEWVGASSGLGIYITRSQAAFRVDRVFVAVVIIAVLSMALFLAVQLLARLASPWMYVNRQEESR